MSGLLCAAASVIVTRSSKQSLLRTRGLQLREMVGFKESAVAVARKLAVIMHTMLKAESSSSDRGRDLLVLIALYKRALEVSLPGRERSHSVDEVASPSQLNA